jgi:hypothetical protein
MPSVLSTSQRMRKSNAECRQPHKPTDSESNHFLVKEGSIGNFG